MQTWNRRAAGDDTIAPSSDDERTIAITGQWTALRMEPEAGRVGADALGAPDALAAAVDAGGPRDDEACMDGRTAAALVALVQAVEGLRSPCRLVVDNGVAGERITFHVAGSALYGLVERGTDVQADDMLLGELRACGHGRHDLVAGLRDGGREAASAMLGEVASGSTARRAVARHLFRHLVTAARFVNDGAAVDVLAGQDREVRLSPVLSTAEVLCHGVASWCHADAGLTQRFVAGIGIEPDASWQVRTDASLEPLLRVVTGTSLTSVSTGELVDAVGAADAMLEQSQALWLGGPTASLRALLCVGADSFVVGLTTREDIVMLEYPLTRLGSVGAFLRTWLD
mgnify:CR=1 FL=1